MKDRLLLPCPEALDRFALYLDGELGERDGFPVEDHFKYCGSCRTSAVELAALHRDLALRSVGEAADPVPALLAKAQWEKSVAARARRTTRPSHPGERSGWGLPAAAAAGIAVCLLLALIAFGRPSSPRMAAKMPETPESAPLPLEKESPPPPVPRVVQRLETQPPSALPPRATAPEPDPRVPAPEPRTEPPSSPRPAPTVESPLRIARVERVEGTVSLVPGHEIALGETIAVDGPAGRAVVAYPDGTRLYLAGDTSLRFGGRGKAVTVVRGEVAADVAPQPRDEPMTFTTAIVEVKVVGTWLAIASRAESTLVQVDQGRVQVTRRRDGWSLPLREGQFTVVETGSLPTARPLPANLLVDPGFEADGKDWGGIFNSAMGRNFGGVSVTTDIARSGRRSLQLITQPTFGWDREVYQDFPVLPGETVDFAGWLRTAGIGGRGVSLSLLWLGAGEFSGELSSSVRAKGAVVREDIAGGLTGKNEWTRLALRSVAPPRAKKLRVLLYADVDPGGPATAWFDDLCLRRFPKGR